MFGGVGLSLSLNCTSKEGAARRLLSVHVLATLVVMVGNDAIHVETFYEDIPYSRFLFLCAEKVTSRASRDQ